MIRVTYKEFSERLNEVQKARQIFITSGLLKNISTAFTIYQELLAVEKMPVTVSTEEFGNKGMSPFDDYIRPTCEKCALDLRLEQAASDSKGRMYPTAWVCSCGMSYYSNKAVRDWLNEFKKYSKVNVGINKEFKKKYTGQKMDLSVVDIKCPKCNGGMYKQPICQGCKEGKSGYKIRLICEENPDHEILL